MVDKDKGRKIARIVIDNDSLGRPGYDNEQTSCDIEVMGDFVPGEFVGHRAMESGQVYAYSAIATEPCKFYTLRMNDILLMLRYVCDECVVVYCGGDGVI